MPVKPGGIFAEQIDIAMPVDIGDDGTFRLGDADRQRWCVEHGPRIAARHDGACFLMQRERLGPRLDEAFERFGEGCVHLINKGCVHARIREADLRQIMPDLARQRNVRAMRRAQPCHRGN